MHTGAKSTRTRNWGWVGDIGRAAAIGALIAALPLASCARKAKVSQKPTEAPAATSSNGSSHEDWSRLGYRLDWHGYPFLSAGRRPEVTSLTVFPDMVLVQDQSSAVAFLEPATGAIRWTSELSGRLTRFVGMSRDPLDAGRILVSSESELYGLATGTGNLVLREHYQRVVNTAPVIEGEWAIYGCSTGEIQAHAIGRGVKAWGVQTAGAIDAEPVRMGDRVGVVNQSGEVYILSFSGTVLGRAKIFGGVASNPVATENALFVAGLDQSVWAFDQMGGLMWRYRTSDPIRAQPVVHADSLYVTLKGMGMTSLETATGRVRWSNKNLTGAVVAVRGGRLMVWNGTTLSAVDPERGDALETAALPEVARITTDNFADGNLYTVSKSGVIGKYRPR